MVVVALLRIHDRQAPQQRDCVRGGGPVALAAQPQLDVVAYARPGLNHPGGPAHSGLEGVRRGGVRAPAGPRRAGGFRAFRVGAGPQVEAQAPRPTTLGLPVDDEQPVHPCGLAPVHGSERVPGQVVAQVARLRPGAPAAGVPGRVPGWAVDSARVGGNRLGGRWQRARQGQEVAVEVHGDAGARQSERLEAAEGLRRDGDPAASWRAVGDGAASRGYRDREAGAVDAPGHPQRHPPGQPGADGEPPDGLLTGVDVARSGQARARTGRQRRRPGGQ
nr:hypothetical protein [Actinomyces procaprae]